MTAYTQQELAAVRRAIAGGELVVQYGDKRVQYRSMDELLRAEKRISDYLNAQARRNRPRVIRLRSLGKGV